MNRFEKSAVITRHELRYPDEALVVDGYNDSGRLLADPVGGGFQFEIPEEAQRAYRQVTRGEIESIPFRAATFSLEGLNGEFAGYTAGESWNGWATPSFPLEEALRVLSALTEQGGADGRYDAEQDTFVFTMSPDCEEEIRPAQEITLPDRVTLKVYPLGSRSWCWDEIGAPSI